MSLARNPENLGGLHPHPDHTVYVLQGGKMALYIREAGRQDTLTFPTGMAMVSGPLTNSGRNIGNTTIKMLVTDVFPTKEYTTLRRATFYRYISY